MACVHKHVYVSVLQNAINRMITKHIEMLKKLQASTRYPAAKRDAMAETVKSTISALIEKRVRPSHAVMRGYA